MADATATVESERLYDQLADRYDEEVGGTAGAAHLALVEVAEEEGRVGNRPHPLDFIEVLAVGRVDFSKVGRPSRPVAEGRGGFHGRDDQAFRH